MFHGEGKKVTYWDYQGWQRYLFILMELPGCLSLDLFVCSEIRRLGPEGHWQGNAVVE